MARKLSSITRADVQDVADRLLADGADPSTIRNALMPLRVLYRRALGRGEVAVNPCTHRGRPRGLGLRPRGRAAQGRPFGSGRCGRGRPRGSIRSPPTSAATPSRRSGSPPGPAPRRSRPSWDTPTSRSRWTATAPDARLRGRGRRARRRLPSPCRHGRPAGRAKGGRVMLCATRAPRCAPRSSGLERSRADEGWWPIVARDRARQSEKAEGEGFEPPRRRTTPSGFQDAMSWHLFPCKERPTRPPRETVRESLTRISRTQRRPAPTLRRPTSLSAADPHRRRLAARRLLSEAEAGRLTRPQKRRDPRWLPRGRSLRKITAL